jgi:hypothetical protein
MNTLKSAWHLRTRPGSAAYFLLRRAMTPYGRMRTLLGDAKEWIALLSRTGFTVRHYRVALSPLSINFFVGRKPAER